MDLNLSTSDLVELCGLDKASYNLPDLCCFCNNTKAKEQVYIVKPCNHSVHAQCVRKVHEYRFRNLITDQAAYRYPATLVLCPICLQPINATVQDLNSLTVMPSELLKRSRDSANSNLLSTVKKVRFDSSDDHTTDDVDFDRMDIKD